MEANNCNLRGTLRNENPYQESLEKQQKLSLQISRALSFDNFYKDLQKHNTHLSHN